MTSPSTSTAEGSALAARSDLDLRVPCYCEENVWRLAYRLTRTIDPRAAHPERELRSSSKGDGCPSAVAKDDDGEGNGDGDGDGDGETAAALEPRHRYHVVFVSNPSRCCPLFHQRAASAVDRPVLWDYHVILLRSTTTTTTSTAGTTVRVDVLDVDSTLPYPCPIGEYLDRTFPHMRGIDDDVDDQHSPGGNRSHGDRGRGDDPSPGERVAPQQPRRPIDDDRYHPRFRVVDACNYLRYFSSDRGHMYDAKSGEWSAEPPTYGCILAAPAGPSGREDEGGGPDGRGNTNGPVTSSSSKSNLEDYITMSKYGTEDDESSVMGRVMSLPDLRLRFPS